MPQKPPRERVAVTHPHGRPTVLVSPSRAAALISRGYTPARTSTATAASPAPDAPAINRHDLIARAKALGIPATGTNVALAAAVEAAEKAAAEADGE